MFEIQERAVPVQRDGLAGRGSPIAKDDSGRPAGAGSDGQGLAGSPGVARAIPAYLASAPASAICICSLAARLTTFCRENTKFRPRTIAARCQPILITESNELNIRLNRI